MTELVKAVLRKSCEVKSKIIQDDHLVALINNVMEVSIFSLRNGHKLLFAGNGGSASDAQHLAAELVGRYEQDRAGLPALALTTNSAQITAIANDYGYDDLFKRQVQALAREGDVFFGLSTSGNSKNIINALQQCKSQGVITVGLTGASGGSMQTLCDYCIKVPSDNTARIQEAHMTIGHAICAGIEKVLFNNRVVDAKGL
ncbi:MAG: D-sedoheptulose 7-phosphate isomerase [Gammaproteobacteria bacterium]|nr:D-sedoheptulose 7-phosphate isomerase [Gammaproteobacteria bacterium]